MMIRVTGEKNGSEDESQVSYQSGVLALGIVLPSRRREYLIDPIDVITLP